MAIPIEDRTCFLWRRWTPLHWLTGIDVIGVLQMSYRDAMAFRTFVSEDGEGMHGKIMHR